VGEVPQCEDRLVSAGSEFAREGEKSHQVAIVAPEFPRKKNAGHRYDFEICRLRVGRDGN
jgi:hypothetical protein